MSRTIELRAATDSDIPLITEWAEAISSQQFMSRYLPSHSQVMLWNIVIVDGTEIGTVWAERKPDLPDTVFLGILIGQSELHGMGIGRRVIREVVTRIHASESGTVIRLNVRASNVRAIACYQACGFVQIASGEKVDSDGTIISTIAMEFARPVDYLSI